MCMSDQTGGLLNSIYGNYGSYGLQRGLAAQQNVFNQSALSGGLGQQMGNYAGMQNDFRSPDQRKLDRALVIAAEIRARRPEMQVKKLDLLQGGAASSVEQDEAPITNKTN